MLNQVKNSKTNKIGQTRVKSIQLIKIVQTVPISREN
jgi:hypothetical protein